MDVKNKDRLYELLSYIFFGVLTTIVGLVTYFAILFLGENLFKISPENKKFNYIRLAAEILQWVFAVLFAFFTNKKWVFKNAEDSPILIQLWKFAASRLATLLLDAIVTFGSVWILLHLNYTDIIIFGKINLSADFIAKAIAAVFVVIANYVLSKIFVFKSKKGENTDN